MQNNVKNMIFTWEGLATNVGQLLKKWLVVNMVSKQTFISQFGDGIKMTNIPKHVSH
jgi:hypothetical protein